MQTNDSSNQVKPDEFRVGDRVWCLIYGEGEVVYNSHFEESYPVQVYFSSGGSGWYSQDGRYNTAGNRTLFFSEPKIEASVTRPFVPTLVGKRVVVKETACYDVCIKIEFENQETSAVVVTLSERIV